MISLAIGVKHNICIFIYFKLEGCSMVQVVSLLLCSKKDLDSKPFLHGVCMLSLCMCLFPPGTQAFSKS